MALSNLIGRRQYHDLVEAVAKLAEKLCVTGLLLQFKSSYKILFVKVLIETNLNIANELIFLMSVKL